MVSERISNNILIDPSLILAQRSINNTFRLVRRLSEQDRDIHFYFPRSLLQVVRNNDYSFREAVSDYFMSNAHPAEQADILNTIEENSDIMSPFEADYNTMTRHSEIYENLIEEISYLGRPSSQHLLNILMEEWAFLQERSWVVSRIKKPFTRFINAGAGCLQFSDTAVNRLVGKTLKRNSNELITKVDRLRAFGKWIAVGGPAITSAFVHQPVLAVSSLVAGYFLLFDP